VAETNKQLEKARLAKSKAKEAFRTVGHVNGVGITRKEGKYAVKVNLSAAPKRTPPKTIDGVPVVVQVVGEIHKQ
jgi:hypothetical protein